MKKQNPNDIGSEQIAVCVCVLVAMERQMKQAGDRNEKFSVLPRMFYKSPNVPHILNFELLNPTNIPQHEKK